MCFRRLAVAALVLAVAFGAGSAAAATPVRVTIAAATLRPKADAPWPVTIQVTTPAGKPLPARLTMRILFGSLPVGKVDDGKVWRFVGTWREPKGQEIKWPAAASGQTFVFEATVRAAGRTVTKRVAVRVR
jgi:hypothetical protein